MIDGFYVDEYLEIHAFQNQIDEKYNTKLIVLENKKRFNKNVEEKIGSLFNSLNAAKTYVKKLRELTDKKWPIDFDIKTFLNEYESLCKKFNLTLAHEDSHGNFILHPFNKDNIKWVRDAYILDLRILYYKKRLEKIL